MAVGLKVRTLVSGGTSIEGKAKLSSATRGTRGGEGKLRHEYWEIRQVFVLRKKARSPSMRYGIHGRGQEHSQTQWM